MKKIIYLLAFFAYFCVASQAQKKVNFYDFKCKTIDGKPFNFSQLKGKKVMIVNVASKCGLTPQYKKLQEMY